MVIQKLLVQEGMKRGLKASREYSVSVLGYDFIGLIGRIAIFYLVAFIINSYFIASIKGNIWLNHLATLFGSDPFPQTLRSFIVDLFTIGIGSKVGERAAYTPPTQTGQTSSFNPPNWTKEFEIGGKYSGMKYFDYGSLEHQQTDPSYAPGLKTSFTINFWQIAQAISVLLVVIEYMQYNRKLKEENKTPNATTTAVFTILALGLSLMVFPQVIQKFKEARLINES